MAPFWQFWGGESASKKTGKTPSPPKVTDPLSTAFIDHTKKWTPLWVPVTPAETPVAGKKRKRDDEVVGKSKKAKSEKDVGSGKPASKNAGAGKKVVGGKVAKWSVSPEDEMELFGGALDDVVETTEVDPAFEDEDVDGDIVHGTDDVEPEDDVEAEPDGDGDDPLAFLDDYDDGSGDMAAFMAKHGLVRTDGDDEAEDDEGEDEEGDDGDEYEDIDDIPDPVDGVDPAEEEVVYVDVEDGDDDEENDKDDTSLEASAFDPSVFEIAETDGSLIADVRARVGSFDADFVPSKLLLDRGWPADSISLIKRLHQRGHEPLFPSHWQMDFRHLPTGLFLSTSTPANKSFINSTRGADFRATKALTRLISLGPKARDKITAGGKPETLIHRELQRYIDWAAYDSRNQFPGYPLIQIHSADAEMDTTQMEQQLLAKLHQLYERWDRCRSGASTGPEAMRTAKTLPTLYGVMVSHTLVGIVTFVPTGGEDSRGYLRSVGLFDFGAEDYDVWNSLALALTVTHARDVAVDRGCAVQRRGVPRVSVARGLGPDPDS